MFGFDFNDFKMRKCQEIKSTAKYSHIINRGLLSNCEKTWISKKINSEKKAHIEALAQEFFRLILPHQPETRVAFDKNSKSYYVLSEEIDGYRKLPRKTPQKFTSGEYSGLGQVLACSMFLQEIDFKNGNVGINAHNQVIKIDGDWCFAEFEKPNRNFQITPKTISDLPRPTDFYTYNWLDLVVEGKLREQSVIIDPDKLAASTHFQEEINQTLLKICLLSPSFIKTFVHAYMPRAYGHRFSDLILSRKNELRRSALKNPSFQHYLSTKAASLTANTMLEQMLSFQFEERELLTTAQKKRTIADFSKDVCQTLFNEMLNNADEKDTIIFDFIREQEDKLSNPNLTSEDRQDIYKALKKVNSNSAKAVRKTIQSLRVSAGLFTIGKKQKANNIAQALRNVPLAEREHLLNNKGVQKALATHRHLTKRNTLYTDVHGDVMHEKAADSFKALQHFIKEVNYPVPCHH